MVWFLGMESIIAVSLKIIFFFNFTGRFQVEASPHRPCSCRQWPLALGAERCVPTVKEMYRYILACVMKNDDEDALLGQESTGDPNGGGDLIFRKVMFLGAILLPTLKWAHSCWSQSSLLAYDCKVLFWIGKCVWIQLSCLNFSEIDYCSIFIITLEKQQNKVPHSHCEKDVIWMPVCGQSLWHRHRVRWGCSGSHQPSLGTKKPSWNANCWIYINVYKLCRSAVEHHCGLGGSHAVLPSWCWADSGFILSNGWFCCSVWRAALVGSWVQVPWFAEQCCSPWLLSAAVQPLPALSSRQELNSEHVFPQGIQLWLFRWKG